MTDYSPHRRHIMKLMGKSVKGTASEAEEHELWLELLKDDELFQLFETEITTAQLCREKLSRN